MGYVGFAFTASALEFLANVPPKIRRQVIKKAKALHTTPFPPGCKKLQGVESSDGDPVYRERSGDYRILYVVKSKPEEVLILDIDARKDVYKMPKTRDVAEQQMEMKEEDFDQIMSGVLGVPPPATKQEPSEKKSTKKEAVKNPRRKRSATSA